MTTTWIAYAIPIVVALAGIAVVLTWEQKRGLNRARQSLDVGKIHGPPRVVDDRMAERLTRQKDRERVALRRVEPESPPYCPVGDPEFMPVSRPEDAA